MAKNQQAEQPDEGQDFLGEAPSGSDLFSEQNRRIVALEERIAELHATLDAAQKAGDVTPYPGFGAHVAHVMTKHFYHDKPEGFDENYPAA